MVVFAILLKILAFLAALSMFVFPRSYKVGIIFSSYLLFSFVYFPGMNALTLVAICFFLSEFPYIHSNLKKISKLRPLNVYISLCLVLVLFTIVFSPNLHSPVSLAKYILAEPFGKFFFLFAGFISISGEKSFLKSYKVIFAAMTVVTFFAVLNLLTQHSIYIDALNGELSHVYDFKSSSRFRVQSTFQNPFDYGFACILFFIISFYLFLRKRVPLTLAACASVFCLLGIFSCGCRTIVLVFVISVVLFLLLCQDNRVLRLKVLAIMLAFMAVAYIVLPPVHKMVNYTLTVFDKDSAVEGSSLEARSIQLQAVLMEINGRFMQGNGYDYFLTDVGWADAGTMDTYNPDLLGLEGVYLSYLLERGIIGFLLYLLIVISIFIFVLRGVGNRLSRALGLSVLCSYVLFSFMTGELLSYQPAMLLVGSTVALSGKKNIADVSSYNSELRESPQDN